MRQEVLRWVTVGAFAAVLGGCAMYKPTDGYDGPTVLLADSGITESGLKGQVFAVVEVDGRPIYNSFTATASASSGKGFAQQMQIVDRQVPVRPMKILLRGSHTTGAPIVALFSQAAGTFYTVEGQVDFSPQAGHRYIVRGELVKDASSVWIEDADTDRPVTAKVKRP